MMQPGLLVQQLLLLHLFLLSHKQSKFIGSVYMLYQLFIIDLNVYELLMNGRIAIADIAAVKETQSEH